ncbi:tetratricopeptide repeat protein [Wenjunlia vitaminophila]|uniref:tetratricopeptide repeat protein n=1 Tax=Wenjunlia vitaminophila TaxID=76728 RepID=UPI0012FF4A7C|nr:tetratricopeptide repeat protein [Wenjunlia vitaminophila]
MAAALLNVSGCGAGFWYLRAWKWLALVWVVDVALLTLAITQHASDHPVLWGSGYLVWLVVMVAVGWRRAGTPAHADQSPYADQSLHADRFPHGAPSVHADQPVHADPSAAPHSREPAPQSGAAGGGWRRWAPFVVAGGLGYCRSVPESELERAVEAHAAGDCPGAMGHYARAVRARYEFTLSGAFDDARYGTESCRVLMRARLAEQQDRYTDAIRGYDLYLARYDGESPPWGRAEEHAAATRLSYADALARRAAGGRSTGTAREDYQAAARAYLEIRSKHPGSAEAEQLDQRFDALYDAGTAAWTDGDRPCEVLDDLRALSGLRPSTDPLTGGIASRAVRSLPDATYACGRVHHADRRYCVAVEDFDKARELAGDVSPKTAARAVSALRGALYRCGLEHYRKDEYEEARTTLNRLVDDYPKGGTAERAADLLVDVDIAEARSGDTDSLTGPSPWTGAPAGTVTVELINESPESMQILYSGPETGRATVEACQECTSHNTDLVEIDGYEESCGTQDRPSITLKLEPGAYDVVIRAPSDDTVPPLSGTWHLASGTGYSDCYYITSTFGYGV